MGRKKEYFLVIDTETANSIEQPLCYDIGYAICDRQGNIYLERSFVVGEIFLECQDLMQSAYYAEKIPQYWEDIKNKKRIVKSITNIRKQIHADMKQYSIKKVGAYNMGFDKRSLNTTLRYCTKSFFRWFFPFGTDYFCIWNIACQMILDRSSYIKFAFRNGLISESGNVLTSAESCYQFLKKQIDFVESHTGLEDVKIEIEILAKCYAMHKHFDSSINPSCWRLPQKTKKAMTEKGLLQEEKEVQTSFFIFRKFVNKLLSVHKILINCS